MSKWSHQTARDTTIGRASRWVDEEQKWPTLAIKRRTDGLDYFAAGHENDDGGERP